MGSGLFKSDSLYVAPQTVRGTAVAPTIQIPFIDGGWTDEPIFMASEVVGADRTPSGKRLGYYQYKLNVDCHFSAKGHDLLMKYHYAKYGFVADDLESGANSHTHKYADAAAEFLTAFTKGFTLEGGGIDKFYTFEDCAVNSFKVTTPKPGMLMISYEIFAAEKTEASSLTGSGTSVSPLVLFTNFMVELKVGADAGEVIQSLHALEYESTRGLAPENDLTSQKALSWEYADIFMQKFGFVINVNHAGRSAINTDYLNAANKSIVITMTSDQVIDGASSEVYKTVIDIPNFNYTGMTPINENGIRRERYDGELAVIDASTPFSMVNYNDDATLA
jgi:hypothetical protein